MRVFNMCIKKKKRKKQAKTITCILYCKLINLIKFQKKKKKISISEKKEDFF